MPAAAPIAPTDQSVEQTTQYYLDMGNRVLRVAVPKRYQSSFESDASGRGTFVIRDQGAVKFAVAYVTSVRTFLPVEDLHAVLEEAPSNALASLEWVSLNNETPVNRNTIAELRNYAINNRRREQRLENGNNQSERNPLAEEYYDEPF